MGADALQAKLEEAAHRLHVPGAAVGVLSGGQETYAFTGVTSVKNPLPVNSETVFQVGSTTKTFTATAMMQLVQEGKVALDAPVRTYVPELKLQDESVAERVTVLQLLNHTAGWHGDFFEETGDGDDALERYVEALAGIPQVHPLGFVASYNNAAVNLAGRVIEKVTGKTYEAALRERVLDPLGLEHSFFFPADVMTLRFAVGHADKDEGPEVATPWRLARSATPAGALISTPADQIRFARFHLGLGGASDDEVLHPETRRRMREPTFDMRGAAIGDQVGVSFLLRRVGDTQMAGHGGTTNGQLSAFQMVPDRGFAVTVLTNSEAGGRLHREMVDWTLEHYLGLREPKPEFPDMGASELAALAGTYHSENAEATITVEPPGLKIDSKPTEKALQRMKERGREPRQAPPYPVRMLDGERFVVTGGKGEGQRGVFVRNHDGGIYGVNLGGRVQVRS